MLGKLIKHEWKGTYRVGCLMMFLTLLVTVLGWLSMQGIIWRSSSYSSFGLLDFLSSIVMIMCVFMLVGICYGTLIYLGVRFYRTMYTDQGYLTHTLPVGKHQLLASKILVSGIWLMIVYAFVFLSIVVMVGSMMGALISEEDGWTSVWAELGPGLAELFEELGIGFEYYMLLLLELLCAPFVSVTILFGSITVGQLFTRARVLMAIVCYVAILVLNGLISSIVQSIATFASYRDDYYLNVSMGSSVLVQVVVAVLLYIASYQVISKRLNME